MPTETYDNDGFLIKMLASDAMQAITILYKTHHAYLLNIAIGVVGNREVAKDLVQDVFHALCERQSSLKVTRPVKAYLTRSVLNRSLNFLKSGANTRIMPLEGYDENGRFERINGVSLLEKEELKKLVDSAVFGLPSKRKVTYILSRKLKLGYADIAEYLGISKKTVEKHVSKALHSIRLSLGDYLNIFLLLMMT